MLFLFLHPSHFIIPTDAWDDTPRNSTTLFLARVRDVARLSSVVHWADVICCKLTKDAVTISLDFSYQGAQTESYELKESSKFVQPP
ncbi:unnamed protein product [Fusarium graminearum]|uniref:Heterokaryon incompatibility domain-containing protein n=1 Tax=Gibberella zeae TaxID=5518 RepID=A0A4E9DMV7_GIBZA|nr:unnamed protein product [Fusarium graminearum]CAG2001476.1 unnamed protein product [Fusarium graminearum]